MLSLFPKLSNHEPEGMDSVRGSSALRGAGAVGWASHEVGFWSGAVVRRDRDHDTGTTAGVVAGACDVERPADAAPDDRRVRGDRGCHQSPVLAAVRSPHPFPAA